MQEQLERAVESLEIAKKILQVCLDRESYSVNEVNEVRAVRTIILHTVRNDLDEIIGHMSEERDY